MLQYASSARIRYEQHLEEKKKQKEAEKRALKRKARDTQVHSLRVKQSRLQSNIDAMEKSALEKAFNAEKYGLLPLLA